MSTTEPQPAAGPITLLLDFGHAEYTLSGVTTHWVWEPNSDELFGVLHGTMPGGRPAGDGIAGDDDLLAAEFERRTGHTVDDVLVADGWDLDLSWQYVAEVTATRDELGLALTALLDALAEDPGGDDGTFDYWPSGMRLALTLAAALDANEFVYGAIAAVAARVINADRVEFADELYGKIGLTRPENTIGQMLTVTLDTSNDAFRDDDTGAALHDQDSEVIRLLMKATAHVLREGPGCEYVLLDVNGNTVGVVTWT